MTVTMKFAFATELDVIFGDKMTKISSVKEQCGFRRVASFKTVPFTKCKSERTLQMMKS